VSGGRLHPEGAPGVHEQFARSLIGDEAYEIVRARQMRQAEAEVRRVKLLTERAQVVNGALVLLVLVLAGAVPPVLYWLWRLALAGGAP
jgi:hypothetical protein